jgi:hypothetical protein
MFKHVIKWVASHKALVAAVLLAASLALSGKYAEAMAAISAALSAGIQPTRSDELLVGK